MKNNPKTEFKKESILGFVGDFFTYGLGNIVLSGITIIMTPILTRIFMPYEYGIIDVLQVSIGVVVIMATLQMDSAILRYYNDYDDKKEMLFTHLLSIISICLIIILFGLAFLKQINAILFKGNTIISNSLPYAIMTVPTTLLLRHILIVFRTLRKPRQVIIISSVVAISYLLLTIVFVTNCQLGIKGVFLAKAISEGGVFMIMFFLLRKHYSLSFSFPLLSKIFKFSLPLMPERVAYIFLTRSNRYFLLTYATMIDIAKFNIAQKVPALLTLAISGFEMAWFPYAFSIMNNEHAKEIFRQIFNTYIKLTFCFTLLIMLFSKEIILILSSKEYLDVAYLVGILGADVVMFGAAQILAIGLLVKERMHWYLVATLISALGNIILNYVLVPLYGIWGAAISLYVANFIICILIYFFAKRFYPVAYDFWLLVAYFISIPVFSLLNTHFAVNIALGLKCVIMTIFIPVVALLFIRKEINFAKSAIKERLAAG